MAHIVVLGAGIGGMPAAYELRKSLGKTHRITVVNRGEAFHFVPSNPWVAVNWRSRKDIEFAVKAPLARKHIDLETTAARGEPHRAGGWTHDRL
jgi:sulfide:quinone oxidoreductase